MHPNAALVTRLYDAFQERDAEGMVACYHQDATFSDPVFPELRGGEVATMWRMLTHQARDFRLTYRDVRANSDTGSARWEARYRFSKRHQVHNVIDAHFEFRDGLIVRHVDSFDFWRWSRMALGAPGWVLGWTPLVQRKVQRQAAARLAAFSQKAV